MKILNLAVITSLLAMISGLTACNSGSMQNHTSTQQSLKYQTNDELSYKLDNVEEMNDAQKIIIINELVNLSNNAELLELNKLYYKYANEVYFGSFGNNLEVQKVIANSFGYMNIKDPYIQYLVARTVKERKLGDNQEVIGALSASLSNMVINDEDAQNTIMSAFHEGIFGNDKQVFQSIIANWTITHDVQMKWSWLLYS